MDHGTTLLDWHQGAFADEPGTGVRRTQAPAPSAFEARKCWLELSQLWLGLTTGQLRACEAATDQRDGAHWHELRVAPMTGEAATLSAEDTQSLSRFLRGELNKWIALDATVATSSVSRQQSHCMELMGFKDRPSRAPVMLALAAHAAAGARLAAAAVEWQAGDNGPIMLLRVERIDAGLEHKLSHKVLAALGPFIDGATHLQIAGRAKRSKNTIGNQLHAASGILRASGRFAVIARLVEQRQAVS